MAAAIAHPWGYQMLNCAPRTLAKGMIRFLRSGLSAWPLILREMRALSRQGQLFGIRLIAGAGGFLTMGFALFQQTAGGRAFGLQLFYALNAALLLVILLVGPVVTSDCIAQEKREGTLGLLFLAPIGSREIILGKVGISALRAFTILFALLPMLTLPVVFGGIPGRTIVDWGFIQITALAVALSSGILASTLHRQFIQAAVCAEIYCLLLVLAITRFTFISIWFVCLSGLVASALILRFCGTKLKEKWEKEDTSFKQPLWVRFFSDSGFWRTAFHWNTRHARSKNPIAWLQEYSWTARLAKWGWCVLVLFFEAIIIFRGLFLNERDQGAHQLLALFVAFGMSLSAANSFRAERLTGAMELLLVTPLSPFKIIAGRLWGIWVHFFPAVAILVFLWIASRQLVFSHPVQSGALISAYLFLPMIGLYVSILPFNILVAWGAVFASGVLLPFYLAQFFAAYSQIAAVTVIAGIQMLFGATALYLLRRNLRARAFVLS